MGKAFPPPIPENLVEWISNQKVFFVATAPNRGGHVNLSPKSSGQFRVSDDAMSVCYLDFTGSGSETSAHLLDSNGRITIMFVNLDEGAPRIVRLFGKGQILTKDRIGPSLLARFHERDVNDLGFRWIISINLERVSTSCGYSIPVYAYVRERETLREVTEKLGVEGMEEYRAKKNFISIDGLFCNASPTVRIPSKIEIENGFPLCYYYGKDEEWKPTQTYVHLAIKRALWRASRHMPSIELCGGFAMGSAVTIVFLTILKGR